MKSVSEPKRQHNHTEADGLLRTAAAPLTAAFTEEETEQRAGLERSRNATACGHAFLKKDYYQNITVSSPKSSFGPIYEKNFRKSEQRNQQNVD